MKIRAKMRCMDCTQHYNHSVDYRFMPVIATSEDEEDKSFWEATPGGEARLTYMQPSKFWDEHGKGKPGFPSHEYKPGDYFYVDMEPDEDGDWTLASKLDNGGQGHVHFNFWRKTEHFMEPGMKNGSKLELHVDNQRAFDGLGTPLKKWKITFTFARASDD